MPRQQAILDASGTDRDELEWDIGAILHELDGTEVIEQAEPQRMYGWVVRRADASASVYLPEPVGPPQVRVVTAHDDLMTELVDVLTTEPSPLAGIEPEHGPAPEGDEPSPALG